MGTDRSRTHGSPSRTDSHHVSDELTGNRKRGAPDRHARTAAPAMLPRTVQFFWSRERYASDMGGSSHPDRRSRKQPYYFALRVGPSA